MTNITEQSLGSGKHACTQQYLSFSVGNEEYGIPIQTVQELRGYVAVTALANAPAHLKGVINLRGTIVPIVDLRIKLGCQDPVYDQFTVVVILNLAALTVGVVVDRVSDVTTLRSEQIKPAPAIGEAVGNGYVTGIGTCGENMMILVDVACLLAANDHLLIEQLAA